MAFTRRIFTKEFRLNAARFVVDEHRPAVDVARELDINPKSLYSWVRQYRSGLLQASLDGEDSVSAEQAEISVLRKAARVRCSSTPVRLESPRKLGAGNGREFLGSGSFLSTVVRSEVAGRSAGIDWRRGFDPIDRSISVDSRTIFSSLIHPYLRASLIAASLASIPELQKKQPRKPLFSQSLAATCSCCLIWK